MRLIDKGKIRYRVKNPWANADGYALQSDIEDMEEVDAIPAEWIRTHLNTEEAERLLEEWGKENE